MLLIVMFVLAMLFGILASIQEIGIPEPFILALFGIAILSIVSFLKRRLSWR